MTGDNDHTQQSPESSDSERLARIETLLSTISGDVATIRHRLDGLQTSMDSLTQTQREMYVDLRERMQIGVDKLDVIARELSRHIRDHQPDSLQSRLM